MCLTCYIELNLGRASAVWVWALDQDETGIAEYLII